MIVRHAPRTAASTGLTPAQLVLAKAMKEEDGRGSLLSNVLDLAARQGVKTAHFRKARAADRNGKSRFITPVQADGKGFPDLVLVGTDGVLYRELKAWSGRLSPEQEMWGECLTLAGASWKVWTPEHWFNGDVGREIATISGGACNGCPAH